MSFTPDSSPGKSADTAAIGELNQASYERMRRCEADLAALQTEEARLQDAGADFVKRGEKIIELCNGLKDRYVTQSPAEQAKLLKIVTSNLATDGVTISPTYEKPFDVLAEAHQKKEWLPRVVDVSRMLIDCSTLP